MYPFSRKKMKRFKKTINILSKKFADHSVEHCPVDNSIADRPCEPLTTWPLGKFDTVYKDTP